MSRKSETGNRKSDGRLSFDSRFPIAVSRPRERGFTMVAVVIGMTVMAILLMGVAPSIATIMKREREQELLFRGKQYARAIALFQKRYGRFPTELKELYENRPRTIRKLFKEPFCNCMDWHVIYQNSPDAGIGGPTGLGPGVPGTRPTPTPTPGAFGVGSTKSVGPIVGVRSNLHEEALTEWRGQKYYDEWRFIMGDADRDTLAGAPGMQGPGGIGGPAPQTTPRGR